MVKSWLIPFLLLLAFIAGAITYSIIDSQENVMLARIIEDCVNNAGIIT